MHLQSISDFSYKNNLFNRPKDLKSYPPIPKNRFTAFTQEEANEKKLLINTLKETKGITNLVFVVIPIEKSPFKIKIFVSESLLKSTARRLSPK